MVQYGLMSHSTQYSSLQRWSSQPTTSVIFVNENQNKNGEKQENNEFVNKN